ncbi:hypothetical protein E2C01_063968 [Portunus trituberculatus]|uniref:Uncharacterized protein n=1 Tax=Portunus trituberculatus TaxID=210409 RepID=A0A5B7HKH0_PORTR|nr:hypothetical protein [Portunus trituberculatus]
MVMLQVRGTAGKSPGESLVMFRVLAGWLPCHLVLALETAPVVLKYCPPLFNSHRSGNSEVFNFYFF